MKISSHKDLVVWQISMDLVTSIYEITKCLPLDEKYGLSSQMRRCAISIPSNIAEGAARQSGPEFKRFLFYSMGSCAELETQYILSNRIGYIKEDPEIFRKMNHIKSMLSGLIKKLV